MKAFGVRFGDIEKERIHSVKLPPGSVKELFPDQQHPNEFIKKYLNDESLYNRADKLFSEYKQKTIPAHVKAKCAVCNGTSQNEKDSLCHKYHLEADLNYFIAAVEFVNLIERNKGLISDDKFLKQITIEFFQSFQFRDGRVSFSLQRITMFVLNAGFLILSQKFAENTALKNLSIIDEAIDNLEMEQLQYDLKIIDDDPYHIEPQKRFFKSKRKLYKGKVRYKQIDKTAEPRLSKVEILREKLDSYGFQKLPLVTSIADQLIENLAENKVPYQIMYLEYLKFPDHLLKNYAKSKFELYKILAQILDTHNRTIKGNLNSVSGYSNDSKDRYTAHLHKEAVQNHYRGLK